MANEIGWIKLHRKIQDNPMYFSEKFCRNAAWVDMILIANREKGSFRIRGVTVVVNRGQIGFSAESLGVRWRWSRGKVNRFLDDLKESDMVVLQKNNVTTLITIVNYEQYQSIDTANRTADRIGKTDSKQNSRPYRQIDTNNKYKKFKENIQRKLKKEREGKEVNTLGTSYLQKINFCLNVHF